MFDRGASPPFRVLVTRASQQASELAGHLRELGAEPLLIPTIQTVEPTSFSALDNAIEQLGTFHWLLFTSANAVEAFASRLSEKPVLAGTSSRLAAIGSATARALVTCEVAHSLNEVLLPPVAVAESLAEALLPFARQPHGLLPAESGQLRGAQQSTQGQPTRFLLVRAEQAREHLPDALRAAGAEVTVAPAYRTVIPDGSVTAIRELLVGSSGPDAITFTSSSSVRNLLALCATAGVTLPAASLCVSIGQITSATLRECGLAVDAEAPEATVLALAESTIEALRRGR